MSNKGAVLSLTSERPVQRRYIAVTLVAIRESGRPRNHTTHQREDI
jgi:hypothetical protein